MLLSVLLQCWFGDRKDIRSYKLPCAINAPRFSPNKQRKNQKETADLEKSC